ncbi:MAG: MarR family transcriptional regulator [Hyphomonadaceae bacterium]
MASRNNVQNTHISAQLRELHGAVLDIVSVMNQPQRDETLLHEAGVELDRALFPLLVGIDRFGPIGVVDLADRVGRDYTTVSRQVAKLESLGLVKRQPSAEDARVRNALLTSKGKTVIAHLNAARERLGQAVFESWSLRDLTDLTRLMRKFADALVMAGG